jgi:hypothetical protein
MPDNFAVHAGDKSIQKLVTATPFALGAVRFKSADVLVLPRFEFSANLADAPVVGVLGTDMFAPKPMGLVERPPSIAR